MHVRGRRRSLATCPQLPVPFACHNPLRQSKVRNPGYPAGCRNPHSIPSNLPRHQKKNPFMDQFVSDSIELSLAGKSQSIDVFFSTLFPIEVLECGYGKGPDLPHILSQQGIWDAGHLSGADLMFRFVSQAFLAASLAILSTNSAVAAIAGMQSVATGLSAPIFVTHAPGDPSRLFIAERGGRDSHSQSHDGCARSDAVLVDSECRSGGEGGLLGLAFHPDYPTHQRVIASSTSTSRSTTAAIRRSA